MRIKSEGVTAPKLIRRKLSKAMWLEDYMGRKLTPKFKLVSEYHRDNFVLYTTSIGYFLCHDMQPDILYQDRTPESDVSFQNVGDNLYKLIYYSHYWTTKLYTKQGTLITDAYTCVRQMNSGLAATEKSKRYGFIDCNANVIIPFKYKYVEDFNEYGYAVVECMDNKMTIIDTKGNELFQPIDAFRMKFLTSDLIRVNMKKGGVGLINLLGKEIIPCVYAELWLKSGYIFVMSYNKYGLYTMEGKIELECIYPEIIETLDKFVVQDFAKNEISKTKEIKK